MGASINVRLFSAGDAAQVRNLFIRVTRLLVPPHMTEVFEGYIARSLREEVDRIVDYYGDKGGAFWVAIDGTQVVGMFGLEPSSTDAMELRRMYVDPDVRRQGIARTMLQFAEDECRRRNKSRMALSTSELQVAALTSLLFREDSLIRHFRLSSLAGIPLLPNTPEGT